MLLGGYFKDAESTESIQAQTNFFFREARGLVRTEVDWFTALSVEVEALVHVQAQ